MKKIIFLTLTVFIALSCSEQAKHDDQHTDSNSATTSPDMNAVYEKNLATLQSSIAAFEKENIEEWASSISDTATWSSAAYGDTVGGKANWKAAIEFFMANWDNLKLNDATFLPGIDKDTKALDGSVRYYGDWDGVYKNGKETSVKFYGTYDFNSDGKIVNGSDFFDVGGLMNAANKK